MYIDDLKLFAKTKRIENSYPGTENIQSKYRDGICHTKMCHAYNLNGK